MKIKLIIICPVLILLAACQKDFLPQVPGGNKMVVNSMFNNHAPVLVYLTTSYPSTNQNNNVTTIGDGHIALYENNVFKENMHYVAADSLNTFGYYLSNLIPQTGNTYSIQASEKNYPTATASDQVPMPARVVYCNLLQFPDTPVGNLVLNMQFQDNPGAENYYRLEIFLNYVQINIGYNQDTLLDTVQTVVTPQILSSIADTVRDPNSFILFTNQGFSGQLKTLQIGGSAGALSPYMVSANLQVELQTVSKAEYEYYLTYQVYENTSYNTGVQSYVYSNVVNGYGIFCGSSWNASIIKLK